MGCGCGAYVPDRPGPSVADERALISWTGTTEDILMSLRIAGSSDKAAWVMPVPSDADVTLGDAEVFEELSLLTAPRTSIEIRGRRRSPGLGCLAVSGLAHLMSQG
ncbi:MAG: hypothetical protein QOD39_3041 [Mycobacterium sp.]|jgi:hypothetical protein|nr:hypothetical protein [Mycobacterium sp.]